MELHNLKVVLGSTHAGKRVGRGLGSGMGKTSTRGQKGAGARSGGAINPGFEGGQTPLYRRIPKRGFKNVNRKEYVILNVGDLARILDYIDFEKEEVVINAGYLAVIGMVKDPKDGLKILGGGEVSADLKEKGFTVECVKISTSAREKIEKAGGKVVVLEA